MWKLEDPIELTAMRPVTRLFSFGLLLSSAVACAPRAGAPAPVLELDHVYILVPPGAAEAVHALRTAGVTVDTQPDRHEGEGTTSIAAFFENGYLELMWVDSSVTVDSAHLADVADFERGSAWRETGASPFGVGLHFLSGDRSSLGVPFRLVPVPGADPGIDWILMRQPAESLAADMFVMPTERAVPTWIRRYQTRRPELFTHASGVHRITRVVVRGPRAQRPHAASLDLRLVGFEDAESSLLTIEFDDGRRGETVDLRPALPVILTR